MWNGTSKSADGNKDEKGILTHGPSTSLPKETCMLLTHLEKSAEVALWVLRWPIQFTANPGTVSCSMAPPVTFRRSAIYKDSTRLFATSIRRLPKRWS